MHLECPTTLSTTMTLSSLVLRRLEARLNRLMHSKVYIYVIYANTMREMLLLGIVCDLPKLEMDHKQIYLMQGYSTTQGLENKTRK